VLSCELKVGGSHTVPEHKSLARALRKGAPKYWFAARLLLANHRGFERLGNGPWKTLVLCSSVSLFSIL